MTDRLLTIALSVTATLALTKLGSEPLKELTVERLVVTKELIVSDGREITGPLRLEGAQKEWTDTAER